MQSRSSVANRSTQRLVPPSPPFIRRRPAVVIAVAVLTAVLAVTAFSLSPHLPAMADLGSHQGGRQYRPNPYSPGSAYQRDAAYTDIFGGAPSGRSHTMASHTPPFAQERSRTMTSHTADYLQHHRPPLPASAAAIRQSYMPNGHLPPNGYAGPLPPGHANGHFVSSQPQMARHYHGRPQYPVPQRLDSRPSPMQQSPYAAYTLPSTSRLPPQPVGPPPALNSDPYRSRSLAKPPGMPPYQPPPPHSYAPGSPATFRQQPHYNPAVRAPQVRVSPDRIDSDRAMTMGAYARDRSGIAPVVPGGRLVPRRRESGVEVLPVVDPRISHVPVDPRASHVPVIDSPTSPMRRTSEGSVPVSSRTMSMASSTIVPQPSDRNSTSTTGSGSTAVTTRTSGHHHISRRAPLVYPALLSRVADVFKARIQVGERLKNDLAYTNAFTGAEAVDLLSYIIKTSDRNLALLLGRALDSQKFFHDVTYDHRLRDTSAELYQFKESIAEDSSSSSEVNGVFTLLTECYSPTCTRDQLCYSIACPRRLEQQARLNLKLQPGLRSSASKGSLHEDDDGKDQKLWINSVPKDVSDSIDDKEKKRQEIIFEIMYTERDFVKDLEYLRDFWMKPLKSANSPIPEHRREKFIRTVFGNCLEILACNSRLAEALNTRQKESHVVHHVGDIFLHFVPGFDPFIKYGANQLYGKYEFEKEKSSNPAFAKFVEMTERLKESRKLELNGYLTKPTTRLARYPLLLDNVIKYTKEDNQDKKDSADAKAMIRDFLSRVNAESGKAENHFNLVQLNMSLKFSSMDYVDLKLTEENRVMLTKTSFKKGPTDSAEVTAYLFDHALLLVRIKAVNKREEYRVYRKPIPLELLVVTQMDEASSRLGLPRVTSTPSGGGFPLTFRHLGKGGYDITLFATSMHQRTKFVDLVEQQQRKLRERNSNFYSKTILSSKFFSASNRVNCLVPIGKFSF